MREILKMAETRKRFTFFAFVTLVFMSQFCDCSFLEELESQKMEFDCYTDICTVGIHFCSREDQACVPCDVDVCNEPDSPSMCKAFCKDKGAKKIPDKPLTESTKQTSPTPTSSVTEPYQQIQTPSCCLLSTKSNEFLLVAFGYFLALVFLISTILVSCFCQQYKNPCRFSSNGIEVDRENVKCTHRFRFPMTMRGVLRQLLPIHNRKPYKILHKMV